MKWFREKYKTEIPLDVEFNMWIEEKTQDKDKTNHDQICFSILGNNKKMCYNKLTFKGVIL